MHLLNDVRRPCRGVSSVGSGWSVALDKDTADLITTRVASAFVDGGKEALARNHEADGGGEGGHVAKLPSVSVPQSDHPRVT